jgi:predicted acyltransferase
MVTTKQRLVSLDAFRGITIAGMILVNNPGSWSYVYPPLAHAEWHGWTPTDLIFPFFLFIVGVAMTFSFAKRAESVADRRKLYLHVVRRSLIIFGLGLFLNGFPYYNLDSLRIPGVLQRIGVVYFFASMIMLNTNLKGQAWAAALLLVGYWGIMKLIPIPGHGAGSLTVDANLAAFVDNSLLHGHMWKETWDPEGLLSTIPAIATTLSGVLVGRLLRSKKEKTQIAGWLFVIGWGAILVGLIWNIWFPINKNLWTSSYVIFTAGAAMQFLGVCYWLIDVHSRRTWAKPAVVYGMNAIAVFVLSGLVGRLSVLIHVNGTDGTAVTLKTWVYQNLFASWAGPQNGSLAFAVTYVAVWLGLMAILYRRRIFIKI